MTLPTTDELKELRKSITPGPWKLDPDTDGIKNSEDTDVVCGDTYLDRDEAWLEWRFDADHMLTVLAPELLDEVIRLREETGLLSPDLPEPDKNSSTGTPVWWENDTLGVTVYPDGEIGMMVGWDEEARFTAVTARAQALALLAAANHAEVTHVGGADS